MCGVNPVFEFECDESEFGASDTLNSIVVCRACPAACWCAPQVVLVGRTDHSGISGALGPDQLPDRRVEWRARDAPLREERRRRRSWGLVGFHETHNVRGPLHAYHCANMTTGKATRAHDDAFHSGHVAVLSVCAERYFQPFATSRLKSGW